jgi:hypothetical protein
MIVTDYEVCGETRTRLELQKTMGQLIIHDRERVMTLGAVTTVQLAEINT